MKSIGFKKLTLGLGVLTALGGSVLTTGCNSEEIVDPAGTKGQVPIQVVAAISSPSSTRSVSDDIHETAFTETDKIRIKIWKTPAMTKVSDCDWQCHADGTCTITEGSTPAISSADGDYKMWGIYPSDLTLPESISSPVTFTVQENQSLDEDYIKSDLMIADAVLSYENPKAVLAFQHVLTKIKIVLSYENEDDDVSAADAKVTLNDVFTTIQMNTLLSNPHTFEETTKSSVIVKDPTNNTKTTVCAVIPKQTIVPTTEFIKIELGGQVYTGKVSEVLYMQAGYVYTFNVSIERGKLSITSVSVEGWLDGGENGIVAS